MSASRYPDNSRYGRDRSPYRDRRQSTYSSGYAPRVSDSGARPNPEVGSFPSRDIPRDIPRGPKIPGDPPRGPTTAAPSSAPSAPRDARGRAFPGRGEATPLREAPPLSSTAHPNTHNSWRADRDRDRDFERDRRDRRPSPPPRRSPIRDVRDSRDQRDFPPRDLDINRARRNSRDGPPSAGSTYSDPPLNTGSSYRGSGIGRGRGGRDGREGRDFHIDSRGRGRNFHDDRERHHDPRDRIPDRIQDRSYRPRSRSREPVRRERDPRDDRDFERRDRDDRRYPPREYDSYIGPAGPSKSGPRGIDTHRGSVALDSRHLPNTPTSATPHSTHHSPADRLGPSLDSYSRRSSVATDAVKDGRRETGGNDLLLAGRAEASRERYAPRASSPPAAVPAFGFSSNVWRNPALDAKPAAAAQPPKPAVTAPPPATPAAVPSAPPAAPASTPSKPSVPAGLATVPPTGPKADRAPERTVPEPAPSKQPQDSRPVPTEASRVDPRVPVSHAPQTGNAPISQNIEQKPTAPAPSVAPAPANSPPQGPAARPRPPPTGPQAGLRANVSPSFPRPAHLPYAPRDMPRDASPSAMAPAVGSRNSSGSTNALSTNTSPKDLPANIPTGPKADRGNPMAARPSMYPPSDRAVFQPPRMPMGTAPKSMQWVRPGLNLNNRTTVPTKREFPADDRDRSFGSAPKAPKFENSTSVADSQRPEQIKPASSSMSRPNLDHDSTRDRVPSTESRKDVSPKPEPIQTRRLSDVTMTDPSPHLEKPPVSAVSSAPEGLVDSDDDLDLDDEDFAESEAKYNREKALLEAKRIDLSAANFRATTPLQEIMLLASLTIEHLPCQESKSVEEEIAPMAPIQQQPESITTELPTPKAEETEDVDMDEKDAKQLAPATRALRLRRGTSDEHEETPDLSSLPYLGSAPLTPISELEGPRVSESVMLAIRNKLRNTIEPESEPENTLEDFARAYRKWREYIRTLDDTKDVVEQERQPSAEPLKATTPDVQSSAMGPLLELPLPATSRRGHSHRWATEYDLESVIKESLKTAEEESKGKRESEPRRAMADPEKEAEVPPELTAYEAQRRRFIDTNFQREPGQGIFTFHYEPPEDDFTEGEHKIMVQHYRDQYAKKWGKLAEALYKEAGTSRTYKDCINHYYATKWGKEYKGKVKGRRGGPRRRGGGAGRGRGAIANMERPDASGEDGLPPALTETGRPRRSAAPTFGGAETDLDTNTSTPTPGRMRRGTDTEGNSEKPGRRGKLAKEKGGRKAKAQPLAAAPIESPVKPDRKPLGVKMEDEAAKRPLGEMPYPIQLNIPEDQLVITGEPQFHPGLTAGLLERTRQPPSARPGPSSYWSVTEQTDFQRNVAYFGTDWAAIATHMGTKTQTMVKNQYLRLVDSGQAPELERVAIEADQKRTRGEDPGPPPTPTPAPKRRYESTQVAAPRTLAPTPEANPSHPMPLPKASPPNVPPSSRFSNIAQAPQHNKPLVSSAGYAMPDPSLASVPSAPQQQSPTGHPPRGQSQHHIPHQMSRPEIHQRGEPPRSGFFSQTDLPTRREHRALSQSSNAPQASRPLQPQVQPQIRGHEQSEPSLFRPSTLQERETLSRVEPSQEHDPHLRFQTQHSRQVSGDLQGRHFPAAAPGAPHMRPPPAAGSPENRPHSLQHPHMPQPQHGLQGQPEPPTQPSALPSAQQLPTRTPVATPPVKEEPRHYPHPHQQPQQPPQIATQLPAQSQSYAPTSQPMVQVAPVAPTPPAPKPAPEPRKSNLLSLLNDTEPEEPRRRKPVEQNVPSHTPTPQQQTPIAPPPPVPQNLPARRDPYDAPTSQAPYGRPSYAQQTALPQISSNRQVVDLTNEQTSGGRGPARDSWQRQPYSGQNQSQPGPAHSSPHPGLAQPAFGDSRPFGNHRAVFAQHNGPRHNPSPPPLSAFSNSPHLHSRTPSLSGAASQQPRHMSSSAVGQHTQPQPGSSQILQPNPYAQVDPPGSGSQPSGPVGMRPSPHLHTSHLGSQRDVHSRNEQSQVQNGVLAYSNPQAPSEHHPASQHMRGPSMQDQYRGRDPRDTVRHDFDARNAERDMSREVSHRADALLREQRDSMLSRSTGPPQSHQEVRYQPPQPDRGFPSQRSHTPLSRSEHGPPPPLQHPPHSSLGDNHPLYGGQRQEDHSHRFRDPFPRDSRVEHMREEQVQQQQQQHHHQQQQRQQQQLNAAMSREDYMVRERDMREREMREREMRDREMRDAQYRESLMRRGQPPPPPPGPPPEQRGGASMPPDWANAVRQQERWQQR